MKMFLCIFVEASLSVVTFISKNASRTDFGARAIQVRGRVCFSILFSAVLLCCTKVCVFVFLLLGFSQGFLHF